MFSQKRTAVEQLAQQPRRSASEDASASSSQQHVRANSAQSHGISASTPSAQLADAAIANLRKSLAQRSLSPKPVPTASDQPKPRSRLEERLRASLAFTIGDVSNSTTPDLSARATPVSPQKDVQSPASTPLPDSPGSNQHTEPPSEDRAESLSNTQPLAQPTPVRADADTTSVVEILAAAVDDQEQQRYTEADIPLPELPTEQLLDQHTVGSGLNAKTDLPELPEVPTEQLLDEHTVGSGSKAETDLPGDVEILRQQLKLFKERFSDVSSAFKRLQAEKYAADKVLQELTPLQNMSDSNRLREYIENASLQAEMSQDEIKRLNGKLTRQEERIEELRDTHRLESKSQSEQINQLRRRLEETEAVLATSQASETKRKMESENGIADMEKLKAEVEKFKNSTSQEEEKRTKAIALLKTVRQKLVRTEKERDEALKEWNDLKEKDKAERAKEKVERQKLQEEIEQGNVEREKVLSGLKAQFDKELVGLIDRHDREFSALRAQFEIESTSRKNTHAKELEARNQQILALETSVLNLTREKDAIFDQLQLRQAELESSQAHMESLEGNAAEHQYQIRELNDRIALLTEELAEVQKERDHEDHGTKISAEQVAQLLTNAEAKYEGRLAELRKQLDAAEKDRNDADIEWSAKFSAKVAEVKELKDTINSSARNEVDNEQAVISLRSEVERLKDDLRGHQRHSLDLQRQTEKVREIEDNVQMQLTDLASRNLALEKHIEEAKMRETQLRTNNKNLREELRKVQSSAALLEKQRNPGLGYWASRDSTTESRVSISSASDLPSRVGSPATTSPRNGNDEEDVNLEYLRNVVLQFLEHKEMRPNLVRVLTTILRFTPQETRRLSRSL